jgi:molybdate transport system regulatory protein
MTARLKLKVQFFVGNEIAIGPGKAALLEAIAAHGSISAAGRAIGMSYRRAWCLVDVMNRCWAEPLVVTSAGGPHGGGARLSPVGQDVLKTYRSLEARMTAVSGASAEHARLATLLRAD